MDQAQRDALKTSRDIALKKRDELDITIRVLSEQLGEPVPDGPAAADGAEIPGPGAFQGEPATWINQGQFYGDSSTQAARKVLEMAGRERPLKTDALYRAVRQGGVQVKGASILYRSLTRSPEFHKVGRGLWGLSEWYPNAKRSGRPEQGDESDVNGDELSAESSPEEFVDVELGDASD